LFYKTPQERFGEDVLKEFSDAFSVPSPYNFYFAFLETVSSSYGRWENLKSDRFSLEFPNDNAWKYLHLIIDKNEKVWFVACDSNRNPSKYWLFEGFIEPIQQILGALNSFEYYVVSKKYDWFLAENHHGLLIGLGAVKSKMLELETSIR
jgi:uncharacterized protein DUF6756